MQAKKASKANAAHRMCRSGWARIWLAIFWENGEQKKRTKNQSEVSAERPNRIVSGSAILSTIAFVRGFSQGSSRRKLR